MDPVLRLARKSGKISPSSDTFEVIKLQMTRRESSSPGFLPASVTQGPGERIFDVPVQDYRIWLGKVSGSVTPGVSGNRQASRKSTW